MSNNLISYKNAIDTMDDIKSKKIDIKATIENTKKADFLGVEESYCQPINLDNFMPADFSELVGSEDLSPNEYYENVFKYLEKDNGIYIALCYLVDGISIDEDNLKFNNNSSLEDDYFIIVDKDFEELIAEYHELDTDFLDENNDEYTSFRIDNAFNPISVKCLSKYELFCDIASDYGISIKKEDEEYKIRFGHRQFTSAGPCMGPPKFYEFTEFGDPAGEESLDNPLNQLMILLMEKVIVFDE